MVGLPEGFEEFVAAASPRLLRTAFLLTQDEGVEHARQAAGARQRCPGRGLLPLELHVGGAFGAMPDSWKSSYGLKLSRGEPVRITVIPERTTGDWEVGFIPR